MMNAVDRLADEFGDAQDNHTILNWFSAVADGD